MLKKNREFENNFLNSLFFKLYNYLFFLFLPKTIDITIAIIITAIIAIKPGHPRTATNLLPKDIIIPAKITPSATALTLVLKSRFKKLAAKVPVHAPVPGSGIPTKSKENTFVSSSFF